MCAYWFCVCGGRVVASIKMMYKWNASVTHNRMWQLGLQSKRNIYIFLHTYMSFFFFFKGSECRIGFGLMHFMKTSIYIHDHL